jgi:glutathionylspermidine synthase
MLSRKDFYEQYRSIFSWYDAEEYACFDVLTVQPATIAAIQQAAQKVWQVLIKAGEVMKGFNDETLVEFGYPATTLDVMRMTTQPPFIARCDFVVTEAGIYLLECNAEVATFIVETFKMNGIVARHFGKQDPNEDVEGILQREMNAYLKVAADYISKPLADCNIVFCALSKADEDIGTVQYLRSLCTYPTSFCPIERISMDAVGAYDQDDRPVDIIYRVYPSEWMVEDKDPNLDVELWDYLEPLIFDRKVALINPMSAFVLQNKALLALVTERWGEQNDDPIATTVARHFLPTFMDEAQIQPPYVAKPTYGREGREVEIVKTTEAKTYYASPDYADLPKVYQQYVEIPTIELDGKVYNLQFSCFLMNGIPAGVGVRIGDTVIGNTSKFLPIGY